MSNKLNDFSEKSGSWQIPAAFCGLSLVVHGAVALQFGMLLGRIRIPEYWVPQFYFLLTVSFFFTILLLIVRRQGYRQLIVLLQFIAVLVCSTPEKSVLVLATCPMVLLIIEAVVFLDWPTSLFVVIGMVLISSFLQYSSFVWLGTVRPAPLDQLVTFVIVQIVSGTLAVLLQMTNTRLHDERARNSRLNLSINRLTDANVGYQSYLGAVSERSAVDERKRLSREIHDTVGYTITTLVMLMEAAYRLSERDPDRQRKLLRDGIRQAYDGLDDIRHSLRELRATETRRERGLPAIKRLVSAFAEATRTDVTIDFSNVRWSFDDDFESVVYRIIQEGMTNSFRHGGATEIRIALWQSKELLQISIRDNGSGTKGYQEGIGISGMRERIERMQGAIEANNSDEGFLLQARIPLELPRSDGKQVFGASEERDEENTNPVGR